MLRVVISEADPKSGYNLPLACPQLHGNFHLAEMVDILDGKLGKDCTGLCDRFDYYAFRTMYISRLKNYLKAHKRPVPDSVINVAVDTKRMKQMFVLLWKHLEDKSYIKVLPDAWVCFENYLEIVGVLQEAHEYTHPQVGRELGKLPSKLLRWATALWLLSFAVALERNIQTLVDECGVGVGKRWVLQAEKLLGFFTRGKSALRTPAPRPVTPPPRNLKVIQNVGGAGVAPDLSEQEGHQEGNMDGGAHIEDAAGVRFLSAHEVPPLDSGYGADGAQIQTAKIGSDRFILHKFLKLASPETDVYQTHQKLKIHGKRVARVDLDKVLLHVLKVAEAEATAPEEAILVGDYDERKKLTTIKFNNKLPVDQESQKYADVYNFFMKMAQIDYGVLLDTWKYEPVPDIVPEEETRDDANSADIDHPARSPERSGGAHAEDGVSTPKQQRGNPESPNSSDTHSAPYSPSPVKSPEKKKARAEE